MRLTFLSLVVAFLSMTSSPADARPRSTPTITVPSVVDAKSNMSVTIANGPGSVWDWVGTAIAGAPYTSAVNWSYLSGTQRPPDTGLTQATIILPTPNVPGSYEARFFAAGGQTLLASDPFTVSPSIAMRAYDFYSKFGVNTNIHNGETISHILADLGYLGLDNIRDTSWNGTSYPQTFAMLAAQGVRLHLAYQGQSPTPSVPISEWVSGLKNYLVTPYPKAVLGVSGPNEPDLNSPAFTYTDGTTGISGANKAQTALYTAMKGNSTLASIPVDMWPAGGSASANFFGKLSTIGDHTAHCDRVNMHDYYSAAGNNHNTDLSQQTTLKASIDPYYANYRQICNRPTFITTETGWYTPTMAGWNDIGTDEYTQARLLLNTLFDHASRNDNKLVYIFNLRWGTVDYSDPGYGVMHDDGTPKISGTAIHNLMQIIRDDSPIAATFSPVSFAYSLSGMPAAGSDFAIAKSNGAFDILLWNETSIWNTSTATRISIPTSTVTVFLPPGSSGSVFDPIQGTSPVTTFSNTGQIQVSLNSAPLIIEVITQ